MKFGIFGFDEKRKKKTKLLNQQSDALRTVLYETIPGCR